MLTCKQLIGFLERHFCLSHVTYCAIRLHFTELLKIALQDAVRNLSEKEKLLLYLKLPTKQGTCPEEEDQPIPLSNTRQEQTQAFQWYDKLVNLTLNRTYYLHLRNGSLNPGGGGGCTSWEALIAVTV